MSDILITIMIVVTVVAIAYYLVKKFTVLLINAILGLILLFIINFFHLMNWIGKTDLGYSLPTILISTIGGLPGVLILVLLSIFGINV
ncbi:MAG: pro-sigmaK processing inhibitor BofA family protein [Methanoregulaceae archaeon]